MIYKSYIEEKQKIKTKQFHFQRWFYFILGIVIILIIILLTLGQIRYMKKANHEFAFCLLLLFHSICVLIFILSTALFCRMTNAVLTTLTIILLSVYTGVHFYIRYVLCRHHPNEDFHLITIRLGFVLFLLILFLPWTIVIVHEYRLDKQIINPRSTTFSWFLYLDFLLIISLLILNIRSQSDFDLYQILRLSIGIPLASLWLFMGMCMANNKTRHWIISIIFYILSIIQIFHLVSINYRGISEYKMQSKINESLILTFICSSTNILIHILTIIISFALINL